MNVCMKGFKWRLLARCYLAIFALGAILHLCVLLKFLQWVVLLFGQMLIGGVEEVAVVAASGVRDLQWMIGITCALLPVVWFFVCQLRLAVINCMARGGEFCDQRRAAAVVSTAGISDEPAT